LKLKHDELLSNFAFNLNLRRYTLESLSVAGHTGPVSLTLTENMFSLAGTMVEFGSMKPLSHQDLDVHLTPHQHRGAGAKVGAYTRPLFGLKRAVSGGHVGFVGRPARKHWPR
jgi:hypothetical protein